MSNSNRIASLTQINRICINFEDQILSGDAPAIETVLSGADVALRFELLSELLRLELYYLHQGGIHPTIDSYANRFPDNYDQIAFAFDNTENEQFGKTAQATSTHHIGASKLPERIGRHRVDKFLGQGGFGIVYLAYDDQLDRQVAVKVPHSNLVSQLDQAEAYLREARMVANLDHPNIVPVYDIGHTDEFPCYFVSKYIEGKDLATVIKEQRLPYHESAELITTVAETLHYAHTQGLVHRDVKPGNILIDSDGKPYVVDFGLALSEPDMHKGPAYAGTPAYMSPEQAGGEGHRVDRRSDVYSLGAVLYEMLVGRRTVTASNQVQMLVRIESQEIKPPRQIDDSVPKELERICLKALSKRASERFTTALEMAEDLRHFLEPQPAEPAAVDSNSQFVKIVPKGLRSFDAHDADFFLELLPGPRDRDGLPDSLRFWKTRIEQSDPDETFSVGLIYGPSGCGKSSLVKAGLLPRLSEDVISVYIEATPDETETRLLHGLRKRCPALEDNLSLKETMAALRRGQGIPAGKKILIVLDQFEQWLHARMENKNTELVQALRHCDGGRVQCIVIVRDDFWMAVTRFMRELEFRLLEGQNSSAVDLFSVRHAEKVLAAFGRAFEVLPDGSGQVSKYQKAFLKESVAGLAEEGKVICVRLALFAEMMKGKPWTPAILKEVGGTKGVGVTFLEETFSASTATPEHRYHQKAARAVLRSLLPDTGIDIKGQMKSYDELLEDSGYAKRAKDFDDLIRILNSEIRLITPTEAELVAGEKGSLPITHHPGPATQPPTTTRYYQLTHDYLVPSLRDWLTRKQKETRRGRAEIKLVERSALWNAKPENRHLPAWWEYGNIRLLTNKKSWSEPQLKMMARARGIHGVRWGTGLIVALVIAIIVQQISSSVSRRNLTKRVQTAVAAMSTSRGILVPRAIDDLSEFPRDMVLSELTSQFDAADETRKLPLAYALAHCDDVKVAFLVSQIENVLPDEVENLIAALGGLNAESVSALEAAARIVDRRHMARLARIALLALHMNGPAWNADDEPNWRYKARLAMLALRLKAPKLAQDMCQPRPDPIQRTLFIEECSTWHGDLTSLANLVAENRDRALRSGVALAVGSVPVAEVLASEKQVWEPLLSIWFTNEPDTLIHSAAGWAMRQWQLNEPHVAASQQPTDGFDWHVNKVGMTMLKISEGSFVRKDNFSFPATRAGEDPINQKVTLTRSFLLADREIARAQFKQFMDDDDYPTEEKPTDWKGANTDYSPTVQHPMQNVNWYDAVMFCNWLSHREGLVPSYKRTGEKETIVEGENGREGREHDAWQLIPGSNGYRLPTEAEWEYACRAGTVTKYSHGDDESMLNRYAVVAKTQMEIPGSKLPNALGLFDAHGNAYEWCQDWKGPYGNEAALSDPMGPVQGSSPVASRVIRGGMFNRNALFARSALRYGLVPDYHPNLFGFRVARTYH